MLKLTQKEKDMWGPNKKESILLEAERLTEGDRQDIYYHPGVSFKVIAHLTKPIIDSNIDCRLKHALYMVQVKVARLLMSPDHRESIVDGAGYFKTYAMILDRDKL